MNHGPHPPRRVDQVAHVLLSLGLEPIAVVLHQEVGKRDQGAQRFLKIVRDDVDELVELAVPLRELVVGFGQPLILFAAARLPAAAWPSRPGPRTGRARSSPWSPGRP